MNFDSNLKIYYNHLIIFFFTSFIFLSFLKFEYFQFRYFILFLLIACIIYFFKDLKNKDYKFIKYFFFFSIFFFTHLLINLSLDNEKLSLYNYFSLLYVFTILPITYYFKDIFNENINKIIYLFIILFICSSIISFFNFKLDNPYFCGGIPDIFDLIKSEAENPSKANYELKLSFKEYIFYENSHLGMVAPGVIAITIYNINNNQLELNKKILILVFFIICFVKSSTTLLLGTTLSLLALLLFNSGELPKKIKLIFILIILFFSSILIFTDECKSRFFIVDQTNKSKKNYSLINEKLFLFSEKKSKENYYKNFFNKFKNKVKNQFDLAENNGQSLTSAIHYNALSILKRSIFEKPFGWGINRYNKAFEYFNNKYINTNTRLKDYNNKDGTNNFVKIFVEFGIFGLSFYVLLFLFMFEKKVSIELKLFYIPILITQSIRGAGYFNGGFILIVFLMLFTYVNLKIKKSI
ncbi:O-antigen ligase family protein [Candidatus Pelagibacter sp.]|uniref:O-antigen ligase family protein n=1 Tax=Candidatus Pelagibacter sp. TaxID=2024849 RepID=UPI003F846B81